MRVYYNIIDPTKGMREEPFTGRFENEKLADKWFTKHGKLWEARGYILVRKTGVNNI